MPKENFEGMPVIDPAKTPKRVVFLDWKELLFPHAAMEGNVGIEKTPQFVQNTLAARDFIKALKETSDCCIVTNEEHGYVEQTCRQYLPELIEEIRTMPIMSAHWMWILQ
jgi:hypothetical protein